MISLGGLFPEGKQRSRSADEKKGETCEELRKGRLHSGYIESENVSFLHQYLCLFLEVPVFHLLDESLLFIFELLFIQGEFHFILLHVEIQLWQHHLLKGLSFFFQYVSLLLLSKHKGA